MKRRRRKRPSTTVDAKTRTVVIRRKNERGLLGTLLLALAVVMRCEARHAMSTRMLKARLLNPIRLRRSRTRHQRIHPSTLSNSNSSNSSNSSSLIRLTSQVPPTLMHRFDHRQLPTLPLRALVDHSSSSMVSLISVVTLFPTHSSRPLSLYLEGSAPLDMTSALALQHLLASNPLALASLSQLAGLTNPQLQSHLAGIVNAGAGLGGFNPAQHASAPPPPQQQQQGQQPHANGPTGASPWLAAQSLAASRNGSASGPSPQNVNWAGSQQLAAASPAPIPPSGVNGLANGTGAPSGSSGNAAGSNDASRNDEAGPSAASASGSAPSKKKRTSTSEGKKPQTDADADDSDEILGRLEDIERRYEIPPLKLIDTGNPEADAEANRLAIEEDKRRRNTAASARFRIKKKQREAALEQAAKELQQRLADLEAENARLRTENGWLKSLITVRPDQAMPGGLDQSAVPNPFSSAAIGQVRGSGSSTPVPEREVRDTPERQSGLFPRGVGTTGGGGGEENAGSKGKAKDGGRGASANGNGALLKRDREE